MGKSHESAFDPPLAPIQRHEMKFLSRSFVPTTFVGGLQRSVHFMAAPERPSSGLQPDRSLSEQHGEVRWPANERNSAALQVIQCRDGEPTNTKPKPDWKLTNEAMLCEAAARKFEHSKSGFFAQLTNR